MVRWTLSLLDNSESYVFEINPNAALSAVRNRTIAWRYSREGHTGVRSGRTPQPWEFSGVLRTEEQYLALLAWLNKRKKVRIVTDLGQELTVRLVAYKPEQAKTRLQAPHRHQYSMSCLILS